MQIKTASFELDLHRRWVYLRIGQHEWYVERVPERGLIMDHD